MTDTERQAHRQRVRQTKVDAVVERAKVAEEAAVKCAELWNIAADVDGGHACIERKGIKLVGAEQLRNVLLIPLRDAGDELHSLRFIQPNGSRRFKTGGTVAGCYCALGGKPRLDTPLLVYEGWATTRSSYETAGYPVAAATNAGNLLAVAQALRTKLSDVLMIVCTNDNIETADNLGLTKTREAAQAIGALLTVPDFGPERPDGATDLNDLHITYGGGVMLVGIGAVEAGGRDTGTENAQRAGITSTMQAIASRPRLMLAYAADTTPEAITWLWPGWLPAGRISLLAGSPGAGKTTLALAISAIVSQGGIWPDGVKARAADQVLIWSSEDDPADTLVPRLMAAGAGLHRIHFAQAVAGEHGELQPFDSARSMRLLSKRLAEMGGAGLLIVDPIVSAVSGDAHRVDGVRRNLRFLIDVAAAHRCAVLGISHFTKGMKGTSPAERVTGSRAFVALARVVLVAGRDEAVERHILACVRSNISPDDNGVSYSIEQVETGIGITASRIMWDEFIQGTAREILDSIEQGDDQERTTSDEAAEFLAGLLTDDPVRAEEIKADTDGAGFAWRTMQRASSNLGTEKRKLGVKEGWGWALPKASTPEGVTRIPALRNLAPSASVDAFSTDRDLRAVGSSVFPEGVNAEGLTPSADSSQSKPISGDNEAGGELWTPSNYGVSVSISPYA